MTAGGVAPWRAKVYVDGFNLYFGLRARRWKRYYWLDVERLARCFLRPNQELVGVDYFTADISGPPEKHQRQQTYLDPLATHTGVTIVRGRYLLKERQCRSCGAVIQVPEEKRTDAAIASRMVADAIRGAVDTCFLVSGDSDLVAPVEVIREHCPAVRIVAAFPPARSSEGLKAVVAGWFHVNEKMLRVSQLPDEVTKANGTPLVRPVEWC
jgi:uncharacterized LabA/DUF88 family protein